MTDKEHAERVRAAFRDLHAAILDAKANGLKVEIDRDRMSTVGLPQWPGYQDLAKIYRVY